MTMQDTMINQEFANLDLSKVAALHQKRTLAFINHFVVTTTGFLNNFTKKCEEKLMCFERKLEKVETTMVLLEARLSSIPEAEVNTPSFTTENMQTKDPITENTKQIDNEAENRDKEESQEIDKN